MGKKSKNSDLGRAIMNKQHMKAGNNRHAWNTPAAEMAAAVGRHTSAGENRRLVSVLEANDVDELMANAMLANQSFAAERRAEPLASQSVVVVAPTPRDTEARRELDATELRIPRRPTWHADMPFETLMRNEMEAFLEWRRRIAAVEDRLTLTDAAARRVATLTPFEKNLDVWRQLWRVVERSDIVLQIVDARNPSLFLCADLVRYVVDDMHRAHLVVMNKADLLSPKMLDQWHDFFQQQGLDVVFFSAFKASVGEQMHDDRVLNPEQLIRQLETVAPCNPVPRDDGRIVVGLCGYPNVGKSSSINVLLESVAEGTVSESIDGGNSTGTDSEIDENSESNVTNAGNDSRVTKRVGVSATPGKTKHFQTLVLTDRVMLCDCPGLVFPNFSTSKAELICAGVLPIDHMRGDYEAPVSLIATRIPSSTLAAVYGLRFPDDAAIPAKDGRPNTYVTAATLLDTHAKARGFMTDHGRPDRSRSARVLLKDFVSGRVVYAHAPKGGGEAGVGASVFARKGRLVHERVEKAENEATAPASSATSSKASVVTSAVAELTMGMDDISNPAPVRALVSAGRKRGGRDGKRSTEEFVRVQRTYDPSE